MDPVSTTGDAGPAAPLIRTRDLAKAFGATRALTSCSFELQPGEVHAIIGENGSGKSTLVKILTGVHRPDSGVVELPGGGPAPASPADAVAAGVITVFQEVLVVGPRSVLDNVWIGTEGLWRARLSDADKRTTATRLLDELLGEAPPLDQPVETLSLSDRQACSIVRALVREPKVLILDEATSALDVATRDRLFRIVRDLAAAGTGVIFISHRMDEIEQLGDRVTVMRSGETVGTFERGKASMQELVRLMTGADHLTGDARELFGAARLGDVVLRANRVQLRPDTGPIDFELHAGELVGLAGLEGHGQDAFLHALRSGQAYAGDVILPGPPAVRLRLAP